MNPALRCLLVSLCIVLSDPAVLVTPCVCVCVCVSQRVSLPSRHYHANSELWRLVFCQLSAESQSAFERFKALGDLEFKDCSFQNFLSVVAVVVFLFLYVWIIKVHCQFLQLCSGVCRGENVGRHDCIRHSSCAASQMPSRRDYPSSLFERLIAMRLQKTHKWYIDLWKGIREAEWCSQRECGCVEQVNSPSPCSPGGQNKHTPPSVTSASCLLQISIYISARIERHWARRSKVGHRGTTTLTEGD